MLKTKSNLKILLKLIGLEKNYDVQQNSHLKLPSTQLVLIYLLREWSDG